MLQLGEGVIGLCKSIVKIEFLVLDFSPGTIGAIISSTTITVRFTMQIAKAHID